MIDLHSHVLPGLDDGAGSLEASVAMARAACRDGIDVIAATPHVRDDYPTTAAAMERAVTELRATLAAEGVELDLRPGGEVALGRLDRLDDDDLQRFGLAGSPDYLLLESPYYGWPLDLGERVFQLGLRGITTVLAHPERNAEVQAQPQRLEPLVAAGTLVQLTAASLDGRLGRGAQTASFALLELGLAHLVASDAHEPAVREIGLSSVAGVVGDTMARWLTHDVPAAIVGGTPIPQRPARGQRRRWWQRR